MQCIECEKQKSEVRSQKSEVGGQKSEEALHKKYEIGFSHCSLLMSYGSRWIDRFKQDDRSPNFLYV